MDQATLVTAGMFNSRYDAIIIGSGGGGSALALRLGQQGMEVLLVEAGDYLRLERLPGGPVGRFIHEVMGSRETPLRFVGGQTKFFGAAMYRMRESDFRETEHPDGATSPAWAISYDELEPYYEQAESLYKVHGDPEGDPSEPQRRADYPFKPIPHGPVVSTLVSRLQASGYPVAPIPRGLDRGPGGRCVLCATCDAHYCTVDGKMDAEIAAIRPALATGRVTLATRTECMRVLTSPAGDRVTGVVLLHDGTEHVLHAPTVAVCAGLEGTATLLRRSANTAHPDGLGNASGSLGRYLAGHSVGMIFPIVSVTGVPPIHTKTFAINAWYDAAPDWPYPTGVVQAAGQMPFWEEANGPMRHVAKAIGQRSLMCFYMTEALPTREAGLVFDGDRIAGRVAPNLNLRSFARLRGLARGAFRRAGYFSIARARAPYIWHEVGTARLGDDPANSVVTPDCEVHGIRGLFVVDASVLPTAGAVNTCLTIVALALRTGDLIARVASARTAEARSG